MKKHEILPAALTVSVFIALFWAGFFFTGRMPFFRDSFLQFYPWQEFAAASLRSGEIPLWNPYSMCGTPFLANLQSAVFYPLKAFFYIMPFVPAFKIFFFLNMLLGALFTYALARSYKLSVWASLLASLVFTLNGHLTNRLEFMSVFAASVWLPLSVLAFKKFNEDGKILWFLALAFSLAMQIFAGSAQIFLYTFMLLSLYLFYFVITGRKWFERSLFLIGAALLALFFSAAQFLPFCEYVFNSIRAEGFNLSDTAGLSLPFSHLAGFIFPDIFGNPAVSSYIQTGKLQYWAAALYCGLLPFIFAFFYGIDRKKPETYFYLASFLFFILYALGPAAPLYSNLYNALPVFRFIRYPATALLGAMLPLAVLSGFGFDVLLKGAARKRNGFLPKLPWLLFVFFIVVLLYVLCIYRPSGPGLFALAAQDAWVALAAAAGFSAFLTLYRKRIIDRDAFAMLLVLLIFADLAFYGSRNNPLCRESEFSGASRTADIMRTGDKGCFRYVIEPETHRYIQRKYFSEGSNIEPIPYKSFLWETKNLLFQNMNVKEQVCNANGYDPMRPQVSDSLISKMMVTAGNRAADLCNVKYIISYRFFSEGVLKPAGKAGMANIYENTRVIPRAFVPVMLELNGPDITERRVFDPEKTLLINTREQLNVPSVMSGTAEIIEYGNRRARMLVKSETGCFAVLTDTWYPGWKAYVDNNETEIYKAYGVFRAVYVKPGLHEVVYRYEPLSFTIGIWVTLVSLIFCGFWGGIAWKRRILA